ncbi:MAG: hypothetical protein ABIH11_05700 [Candidatus Altiarchaeota archaeon]
MISESGGGDAVKPPEGRIHEKVGIHHNPPDQKQTQSRVRKAILDCIHGRRSWDKPITPEVDADVSSMMAGEKATPLSPHEEDVVRANTRIQLLGNGESLLKFARWVDGKEGPEEAERAVTDIEAFDRHRSKYAWDTEDYVSVGENERYWMHDEVCRRVGGLYDGVRPVSLWDIGGGHGRVIRGMKDILGDSVSAHMTDLGYRVYREVDGVHLMGAEVAPAQLRQGVDIIISEHSLRHSPLPNVAVRNMLNLTRHAAYIGIEDYVGLGSFCLLADKMPERETYLRYLYGGDPPKQLETGDMQDLMDKKLRAELKKAEESGFDIRVRSQLRYRNDKGKPVQISQVPEGEFMPLKDLPEKDYVGQIIAVRRA